MKTILLLLLSVGTSLAGFIPLKWSPSPTAGVTNYVLLAHTNNINSDNWVDATVRLNCGIATNALARVVGTNATWYFSVIAQKNAISSDLSNVLIGEFPAPPADLRAMSLDYTFDLTSTNWLQASETLFIRLRPH